MVNRSANLAICFNFLLCVCVVFFGGFTFLFVHYEDTFYRSFPLLSRDTSTIPSNVEVAREKSRILLVCIKQICLPDFSQFSIISEQVA